MDRSSHSKSLQGLSGKLKRTPAAKGTNIGQALHRAISDMYHQDLCTDFEIVVGDKTFRCHKVVLAAMSDYFQKMFTSGMVETVKNQATFDDVSVNVFEMILGFLYPKSDGDDALIKASEDDMSELLRVAEMLQMNILTEKCISYFKTTMSSTNCIERWKMAKSILNKDVSEAAWSFLLDHFESVVSEDMMLSLTFEDISAIIEDEQLTVDNEDVVWKAIYQWIKFDEPNRKAVLVDLLRACCLTEVTDDTLFEDIAFDPLVRENGAASRLVLEAIQYRRHPSLQTSMDVKLRQCMDKEQMLVFIGKRVILKGSSRKRTITETQTMFKSSRQQKLITVRPLENVKQGMACCVHGTSMFVTNDQKLFEYIAVDDKWEVREPMLVSLRGHTMSVTDDSLFAIGGTSGFSLNSQVLKYTLLHDDWAIEGEILVPVRDASSVCIKNKIYIFGGKMSDDQFVDSIQEYDVKRLTSTILSHLPTPCRFSRAVNRGNDVYIVTSEGEVIRFSIDSLTVESISRIPDFRRVDFGIEMRNNVLHIFGGRKLTEEYGDQELAVKSGRRSMTKQQGGRKLMDDSDSDDHDEDEDGIAEEYMCTNITVDITSGKMAETKPFQFPMEVFGCSSIVMSTKVICHKPV